MRPDCFVTVFAIVSLAVTLGQVPAVTAQLPYTCPQCYTGNSTSCWYNSVPKDSTICFKSLSPDAITIACPPGCWCPSPKRAWDFGPCGGYACPAGRYQQYDKTRRQDNISVCLYCTAGTFNNLSGQSSASDCMVCAAGHCKVCH